MIHPSTELRFISQAIGSGVFATELIPRGTITWTKCAFDQVLAPTAVASLGPAYRAILDRYAYRDARGDYVLCWDLGRYMNHSCQAAVISPGFDVDVAVRDIRPGEELTCDYGMLNLDAAMDCHCGAPGGRKRIGPTTTSAACRAGTSSCAPPSPTCRAWRSRSGTSCGSPPRSSPRPAGSDRCRRAASTCSPRPGDACPSTR